IFGQWFAPEKVAITVGIYLGVSNGAIALGTGTAALFPSMKTAFLFSAALAVLTVLLYLFFMRDKKEEPISGEFNEEKTSVLEGVKASVKNKYVWIAAACLMLNISAFCSMSQFLPQALASRGIAQGAANTVAMAFTFGGLLSCFVTPSIFFKIGHTKLLIVIYSVIAALGMIFAWKLSDNTAVLFILIFITGFFGNGFSPIISALPIRLAGIGVKYAGTAGGVIATLQLAGTVIFPSYIISPIAGSNYALMFILFAALDVILCFVAQLLPKMD
ncbi:MAG: MFS transporter, partial [Oscillospiraceae bacterium]|nr:MFS transporter [Oscillospiraceae bacterium]